MFNAYKLYWKNYFNFAGKSTVGEYWLAFLCNCIISFVLGLVLGLLSQKIGEGVVTTITSVWSLANLIPGLAIFFRRLRDGGNKWTNVFWFLLPIVGEIIIIIKLFNRSK